ncbi:MAG: membrane-bound O-acyltransferase family protein [Gammaproteobacteria bacterium]|nr:MAG: membrane-bound O-acyltransferase family protein [Gammaproteobacteria bacterium]
MSYLSVEFAVGFLLFFVLYWSFCFSPRLQNTLLLLASYALLASFNYQFAVHLMAYTLVVYGLSVGIAFSRFARAYLVIAVAVSIANLLLFKYFDFFREFFQALLQFAGLQTIIPAVDIILPIGISYYTFHAISYLVSLYRKDIEMPSIDSFALFLAFFPTLVAGPINRAKTMLPQIDGEKRRQIRQLNVIYALIILAVAKKLWLAAYLSEQWVQPILGSSSEYHGLTVIAAIYAYALQIFLDFSGYTDLMIALALLLGFKIPINFAMPYTAVNVRDFWRRWHISLSTWIRDYIYFPLGGSRQGFTRTQINVMVAMVLSGIWHGVGLSFIVWGTLHGVAIVCLNISDKIWGKERFARANPYFARWLTFHFICLTWVFFYAPTLTDARTILTSVYRQLSWEIIPLSSICFVVLIPLLLWLYPYTKNGVTVIANVTYKLPWLIRPVLFAVLLLGIILLSPEGIPAFIYATF